MPTKNSAKESELIPVTIHVDPGSYERFKKLASDDDMSLSAWCRMALCSTAAALSWRPPKKVGQGKLF